LQDIREFVSKPYAYSIIDISGDIFEVKVVFHSKMTIKLQIDLWHDEPRLIYMSILKNNEAVSP
jgi:hypothetical protein